MEKAHAISNNFYNLDGSFQSQSADIQSSIIKYQRNVF